MSDFREMPLARLTICPCGYRVLHDHITVGTVYRLDIATRRAGYTYRCGKCKAVQANVEVVDCEQKTRAAILPLPFALFEVEAIQ